MHAPAGASSPVAIAGDGSAGASLSQREGLAPVSGDSNERMLGIMNDLLDDSKKVTIDARQWQTMRRILARMMVSWTHCLREARLILDSCKHAPDCHALADPGRTCSQTCPDREKFLSARVVMASAIEFVGKLQLPTWSATGYIPPTREYFDRVLSKLEAMSAARDWLEDLAAAAPKLDGEAIVSIAESLPAHARPLSRLVADPAYPAPERFGPSEAEEEEDEP